MRIQLKYGKTDIADEGDTSLLVPLSWFTIKPEVMNVFVQIMIDKKI